MRNADRRGHTQKKLTTPIRAKAPRTLDRNSFFKKPLETFLNGVRSGSYCTYDLPVIGIRYSIAPRKPSVSRQSFGIWRCSFFWMNAWYWLRPSEVFARSKTRTR
jgi:hypothetical protein